MAKFKKALALVLSLAMVLTLAPIASVNSQAAAKYKISAKTTAIAAGKTYNVKVTGVKKGQYVKVARTTGLTVKYNKKTIKASKKVAGTGKALTFKVTAPGQEKAYKATIKVAIFDKKTNKKVKTLKTTRKIKALPVQELKIESVEAGTDSASGNINIVVARFSTAFKSLDPSEITIRRVSDGQLFLVEKVVLSTDGKSATITLAGDNTKAAVAYLEENVDYNFSVTQSGKIAEKVFTVPATIGNATVVKIDAKNKKIDVRSLDTNWRGATNLIVPDSIKVNYEEILGKTFTVSYDKSNTITKFVDLKDKVVYGAFKADVKNQTLTDLATGDVYSLQTAAGKNLASKVVTRAAKGAVSAFATNNTNGNNYAIGADGFIAYAKLVLASSGAVKFAEIDNAWTGFIKVGKVSESTIIDGKTEVSLKDYVIVKDGKSIAISDIAVGDVVAYDNTNSFAEVYSTKVSGKLESVYNDGFKLDGKEYKIANADATKGLLFQAKYSKENATEQNVTAKWLDSVKTKGDAVTVYLNRANQPVFVEGTTGEVASTSKTIILTDKAKLYNQSLVDYVRIKGFDGTAVTSFDIDTAKLTAFVDNAGKKATVDEKYDGKGAVVAKFKYKVVNAGTDDDGKIDALDSTGAVIAAVSGSLNADMVAGELVTLTVDSKNQITGISFPGATTTIAANDLKKELTKVAGVNGTTYQLAGTTPLYVYDAAASSVSMMKYSEFTGQNTKGAVDLYSSDGKNVDAIVATKAALGSDAADEKEVEGIVTRVKYNSGNVMTEFSYLVGTDVKSVEGFASDIKTVVAVGDIVTVKTTKDEKKLKSVAKAVDGKGAVLQIMDGDNSFKVGNSGTLQMATSGTTTIAKLENGEVAATDLGTIFRQGATNTTAYSTTGAGNYVDSIIVFVGTGTDAKADALTEVKDALTAMTTLTISSDASYKIVKSQYDRCVAAINTYLGFDGAKAADYNTHTNFDNVDKAKKLLANVDAVIAATKELTAPTLNANGSAVNVVRTITKNGVALNVAWTSDTGDLADADTGTTTTMAYTTSDTAQSIKITATVTPATASGTYTPWNPATGATSDPDDNNLAAWVVADDGTKLTSVTKIPNIKNYNDAKTAIDTLTNAQLGEKTTSNPFDGEKKLGDAFTALKTSVPTTVTGLAGTKTATVTLGDVNYGASDTADTAQASGKGFTYTATVSQNGYTRTVTGLTFTFSS